MIYILPDLKDPLNYGNYGMYLIMSNAGRISSTVVCNAIYLSIDRYVDLLVYQSIYLRSRCNVR